MHQSFIKQSLWISGWLMSKPLILELFFNGMWLSIYMKAKLDKNAELSLWETVQVQVVTVFFNIIFSFSAHSWSFKTPEVSTCNVIFWDICIYLLFILFSWWWNFCITTILNIIPMWHMASIKLIYLKQRLHSNTCFIDVISFLNVLL